MSLFGGGIRAPRAGSPIESEFGSSYNSSPHSSPPVPEAITPPVTQDAQSLDHPLDLEDDEDVYTDSESEHDGSREGYHAMRPNRYFGKPQTWKGYTAGDRQIAESLDQIENSDLAAHLYNAHALKRRARRTLEDIGQMRNWQGRENWLKSRSDLHYTDAAGIEQTQLVPLKDWTAWPLPPTNLANIPLQVGTAATDSQTKEWIIGGAYVQDPGEELGEELLAVFLRIAKETWNARTVDTQDHCKDDIPMSRSRSRLNRSRSVKSHQSTAGTDTEMEFQDDEGQDNEDEATGKKRGRKVQIEEDAEAIFLADDMKARKLLEPSIQSILTKLEELAMAIHYTRVNHFARGPSGEQSSHSDPTSGVDSTSTVPPSSSKAAWRATSRKKAVGRSQSKPSTRAASAPMDNAIVASAEPHPEVSEDSSEFDDPSYSNQSSTTHAQKRPRSQSTASEDSASTTRDRVGRSGLIDWSEVLGLAAVKGWDEGALTRTAQRCASLFGEDMSFLPFEEASSSTPTLKSVDNAPSSSPMAPSMLDPQLPKRPFFPVGTLRCPHASCYGHHKDFPTPYRVVEHCTRVHGYDPRTNNAHNEERTMGGVQIDGFLQPVTVKPGWLGHGRAKAGKASKKQKTDLQKADLLVLDTTED